MRAIIKRNFPLRSIRRYNKNFFNKKHTESRAKSGSSGRTRTYNLVVTIAPKFLLGLDYLITRFKNSKWGCRALPPGISRSTSFRSSLCTFPGTYEGTRAWLRVTIFRRIRKEGFLEFTRFFNHDFSWKLQPGVNFSVTVRTKKYTFVQFLFNPAPTSGVSFIGNTEVFFRFHQVVKF